MTPSAERSVTAIFVLSLAVAGVVAWSGRAPNSDLFMCLAGGRDISEGKLGQPDDWSYLTEQPDPATGRPRVWINQSWLTSWLLYQQWRGAGETGLVATRAALILLWLTGLTIWLRRRSASWPAALLAAAVAALVCRYYLPLRGNLVTIAAFPWLLWLLQAQRAGSRVAAAAAAVLLGLWGQCHGGYAFALAVAGLWLFVLIPGLLLRRSPCTPGNWALLAVLTAAAAASVGLLSPYGMRAYGQSTMMAQDSAWRTIHEWWPLIQSGALLASDLGDRFEEVGPFLILLLGMGVLVPVAMRFGGPAAPPGVGPDGAGPRAGVGRLMPGGEREVFAFDVLLIAVTLVMAFAGRRFVPLATTALCLPLAHGLDRVWCLTAVEGEGLRRWCSRRRCGAAGMVSAVILAGLAAPMVALGYSDEHPFYPPQSVFERQTMGNRFPVGAARFMRINGIGGNVFHAYEHETYLRWAVPGIKVGCGGRAQQIYSEYDLKLMRSIVDPTSLQPRFIRARLKIFDKHRIDVLLLPSDQAWDLELALIDTAQWLPVYFDGDYAVLVRPDRFERLCVAVGAKDQYVIVDPQSDPGDVQAAAHAAQGKAVYPSVHAHLRTLALYFMSPRLTSASQVPPEKQAELEAFIFRARRQTIERAIQYGAHPLLYSLLDRVARRRGTPDADLTAYLQSEWDRLAPIPLAGAMRADVPRCRAAVASLLAARLAAAGDEAGSIRMQAEARRQLDALDRLAIGWQW